jgi:uncharacterized protein (DUF736 family)
MIMPAIGRVTKQSDGSYRGYLATLSIRKNIEFQLNKKTRDHQPDFVVMAGDIEIGAAWNKIGQASGKDYVSVSLAAHEFGDRTIYANLGQAAGSDDENDFALIWNPSS